MVDCFFCTAKIKRRGGVALRPKKGSKTAVRVVSENERTQKDAQPPLRLPHPRTPVSLNILVGWAFD